VQICDLLGEVGAYGVNFHDNDLIPIDATSGEAERIKKDFKKALKDNGLVVPMATTNPVFRPGLQGRRVHVEQRARPRVRDPEDDARDGPRGRNGREDLRLLGRARGRRVGCDQGPDRIDQALPRGDQFLCEYSIASKYGYKFAVRSQAQRAARAHLFRRSPGSYLAFIPTLDHPEMCGVNPEVAHEHMAGLNFVHQVAAALEAGKLFHIDLNDQEFGRYDQDFRFGQANLEARVFPGEAAARTTTTTARGTSTRTRCGRATTRT
jgi:xylose isomerase